MFSTRTSDWFVNVCCWLKPNNIHSGFNNNSPTEFALQKEHPGVSYRQRRAAAVVCDVFVLRRVFRHSQIIHVSLPNIIRGRHRERRLQSTANTRKHSASTAIAVRTRRAISVAMSHKTCYPCDSRTPVRLVTGNSRS